MAKFLKNEATAAKRKVRVFMYADDGVTPAVHTTDFTAAGVVQIDNGSGWTNMGGTFANVGSVDGDYQYTATQAELNVDASEFAIKVDKSGFRFTEVVVDMFDLSDVPTGMATATALATAQTAVTDIQTDVDELQTSVAAIPTTPALASALATAQTAITDIQTDVDELQTSVAAIPTTPALASALATAQTAITGIQTDVDEMQGTLEGRLTATRAGYLDNLSAGAVALASALATAQTAVTDIQTDVDELQTSVAAIPTTPALASALATAQTAITDIQTDVDELQTTAATLATSAALATAQTAITDVQGDVDGIETAVATLATASALSAAITTIDGHTDTATAPLATATALGTAQAAISDIQTDVDELAVAVAGGVTAAELVAALVAAFGNNRPTITALSAGVSDVPTQRAVRSLENVLRRLTGQ